MSISFGILLSITLSLLIIETSSGAFAEQPLKCEAPLRPYADLSGCSILGPQRYLELQISNLTGINLAGAILDGQNIQHTDLRHANLQEASLVRAAPFEANLEYANLTGARLHGDNLEGSNLKHTDLRYADLTGADLTGADLSYSDMRFANLQGANLYGTNLQGVNHNNTNFHDTDLEWAHMGSIKFSTPIKQIEFGRDPSEVVCPPNFVLLRSPANAPVCLSPADVHKIIARNWTIADKSVVTMTEGEKKGPFLLQAIYPDRVLGTIDWAGPVRSGQTSETLHIGQTARTCEGGVILLLIDKGKATFATIQHGTCPVCLSGSSVIDTPEGTVNIKNLKNGMTVWTADNLGHKQSAIIVRTGKTPVPPTHMMIHIVLDDHREIFASPGHPTADGRFLGELDVGSLLDNSKVKSIKYVPYDEKYTYDILPSGSTGFYWADGILVGSTLK